jgi:hypothetical protein
MRDSSYTAAQRVLRSTAGLLVLVSAVATHVLYLCVCTCCLRVLKALAWARQLRQHRYMIQCTVRPTLNVLIDGCLRSLRTDLLINLRLWL